MKIDFDDLTMPIYIQLADIIEDAIFHQIYEEESKIPSIVEISLSYHINPATANKSVALLTEQGILYKMRGIGMYVTKGGRQLIMKKRTSIFNEKYIIPLCVEARKLNISEDELQSIIQKTIIDLNNKEEK